MPLAVIQDKYGKWHCQGSSHDAQRTSGDHKTEWVGQPMSTDHRKVELLSIRNFPARTMTVTTVRQIFLG